mgnify:CR=1 FL=1
MAHSLVSFVLAAVVTQCQQVALFAGMSLLWLLYLLVRPCWASQDIGEIGRIVVCCPVGGAVSLFCFVGPWGPGALAGAGQQVALWPFSFTWPG